MSTENVAMDWPRDVLGRCLELFHQGLIAEADRLAGEGLESSPDDGDLWQMQGLLRQCMGDFTGRARHRRRRACWCPSPPRPAAPWPTATLGRARQPWPATCTDTSPATTAPHRNCSRRWPPASGPRG